MRKFQVTVNGTQYEIEVEEIAAGEAKAQPAAVKPAAVTTAAVTAASGPKPVGKGEKVNSPMPGTILQSNVAVGQKVKSGQTLMILEAMKMENEILAPADGTITQVAVQKGASVEAGTLLCVIE